MQGCEQIGQLKSSLIIDLSDERMRKVVFFALILELGLYCDLASEKKNIDAGECPVIRTRSVLAATVTTIP